MAKEQQDRPIDVTETIDKTERYVQENRKSLSIIAGSIIAIFGLYFGYQKLIVAPQEEEAQGQMYAAVQYFEKDSLDKAINGDGNYPGFKKIIEDYSMTPAANLAHYYLGMSYLKKGQFENAIETLEEYDGEDQVTGILATGAIGDAHLELGRMDEALEHYQKAADKEDNQFTTPIFLQKAALVMEAKGEYGDAAELYKRIKKEFPESNEGRQADKFIARAEAMAAGK